MSLIKYRNILQMSEKVLTDALKDMQIYTVALD